MARGIRFRRPLEEVVDDISDTAARRWGDVRGRRHQVVAIQDAKLEAGGAGVDDEDEPWLRRDWASHLGGTAGQVQSRISGMSSKCSRT